MPMKRIEWKRETEQAVKGTGNMPPQNKPLWHMGYFELKATENQQMQETSKSRAQVFVL